MQKTITKVVICASMKQHHKKELRFFSSEKFSLDKYKIMVINIFYTKYYDYSFSQARYCITDQCTKLTKSKATYHI